MFMKMFVKFYDKIVVSQINPILFLGIMGYLYALGDTAKHFDDIQ